MNSVLELHANLSVKKKKNLTHLLSNKTIISAPLFKSPGSQAILFPVLSQALSRSLFATNSPLFDVSFKKKKRISPFRFRFLNRVRDLSAQSCQPLSLVVTTPTPYTRKTNRSNFLINDMRRHARASDVINFP